MLAPKTVLQGRYRIIRLINQGNMGAVYLAEHIELGNEVALKETFAAGGDAEVREQFRREARLLSKLRHPSLPRVTDHFIEGSGQFLVMDYIIGEDLQESLRNNGGPFPVDTVLDWADQLLEVLTYLHEHQEPVIHRDIKPANIKLTPQGKVILLDFGLAKGSTASLQMSFPAATPAYAPFEQVTCQGTDARSDLYALAATLHHLLTGTLPPIALLRRDAVIQGQPDPLIPANQINWQVPTAIAQVLTRAMSPQASDRPASAEAMRRMLSDAAAVSEQSTVIRLAESEVTTTTPMISDSPRKNNQPVSNRPLPPEAPVKEIVLQAREETRQPQPVAAPSQIHLTKAVSFLQHVLWRHPSGRKLGTIALLVAVVAVLAWMYFKTGLRSFEFDVVTVNAAGEIIDRSRERARYYSEPLGEGVTLDMVEIPKGTFQMGSTDAQAAIVKQEYERVPLQSELPETYAKWETGQHTVTVPAFFMGKFEVTQAQWQAVVSQATEKYGLDLNPSEFKGKDLPVERVSKIDATKFCKLLSQMTGKEYRLPTEAEWEYACRAGTQTEFAFGRTITTDLVNYDGNYPFGEAPQGPVHWTQTTEVGHFKIANRFGLYDMHGNVYEWCSDSWHERYTGEEPFDGSPWIDGGQPRSAVLRGGCWHYIANFCRSASRLKVLVTDRDNGYGFRVVYAVPSR